MPTGGLHHESPFASACSRSLRWLCHSRFQRLLGRMCAPSIPRRRWRDRPDPRSPIGAQDVAIDGGYIIVLAGYEGGQQALLYRRSNSTGQWVYRRALVTWTGAYVRDRRGDEERHRRRAVRRPDLSCLNYRVATTCRRPAPRPSGITAASPSPATACSSAATTATTTPSSTRRTPRAAGPSPAASMTTRASASANSTATAVELHYDYALLRRVECTAEAQAWRRNGSALNWVPAGVLALLPEGSTSQSQVSRCKAPRPWDRMAHVWRRSGTSTWTRQGVLTSVDREQQLWQHIRRRCTAMACS